MPKRQSQACGRLSALGLRQEVVHQLLNQVQKWIRCSGEEWTVSRLKDLKTYWLNREAGQKIRPTWLSVHSDGTPVGPFRSLFRSDLSFKKKVRALNALMVYTSFEAPRVTKKQWTKFIVSVEQPPMGDSNHYISRLATDLLVLPKPHGFGGEEPPPLDKVAWSATKRAPLAKPNRLGQFSTVPETEIDLWLPDFFGSLACRGILRDFRPLFNFLQPFAHFERSFPGISTENSSTVGRVSFLQEPGFKLRAIANPNRVLQVALMPLRNALFEYLKLLPEDATYDQDAGVRRVKSWLDGGATVTSVDLSDATNVFPRDVQEMLLHRLGFHHLAISLFMRISSSPWLVNDPVSGYRKVTWTKGQPLGLGPSFASFAIAHHWVVRSTQNSRDDEYVLLGDDIVLKNVSHATRYMEALKRLGCPFSPSKTFQSASLAEFAGKTITPAGIIPTVKWREVSDRNFLDYVRFFGPRFLGVLRPRQRRIACLVKEIPESLGGLGFNPKGKSLAQRFEENAQVIRLLDSHPTGMMQGASAIPLEKLIALGIVAPFKEWSPRISSDAEADMIEVGQVPRPEAAEVQERIRVMVGIDKFRSDRLIPGYVPLVPPNSDPRGSSQLETLERKLDGLEPNDLEDLCEPDSGFSP